MCLFSYQISKDSIAKKLLKEMGSKKFLKLSPINLFNRLAAMAGLRSRVPRVVELGELFVAAMHYTAKGEQPANFKFRNFYTLVKGIIQRRLDRADRGKKVKMCKMVKLSVAAILQRLHQDEIPEFMRLVLDLYTLLLLHKRPKYSFSPAADTICKLCGVKDVCMIDGTYIPVRRSDRYECRAGDGKAGLALHCLTSLKTGSIVGLDITQGACNERLHVPIQSLSNTLLLADRGYPSYEIFCELMERANEHNVKFLFRAVPCFKMEIISAVNADGTELQLKTFDGDVDISDPANHVIDIQAIFRRPKGCKAPKKELTMRAVRVYRPHDGSWIYFITNIPADQLKAASCAYVYKLRWACEQIYKCAKSFTSLARGINSTYFNVVLFFIVASICTMIVRTVIAAYMRPGWGRVLSMLKVHERLKNYNDDVITVMCKAPTLMWVLGKWHQSAIVLETDCLLSRPSKRDKLRAAVFSEVHRRLLCIQGLDNEALV